MFVLLNCSVVHNLFTWWVVFKFLTIATLILLSINFSVLGPWNICNYTYICCYGILTFYVCVLFIYCIVFQCLLSLFTILRKKAWNYGRLALVQKYDNRYVKWINLYIMTCLLNNLPSWTVFNVLITKLAINCHHLSSVSIGSLVHILWFIVSL